MGYVERKVYMVSIKLDKVYKMYDKAEDYTVKDFNIDIQDREFIVFVGPSGCGKSTTLRMIAGLEDISEGDLLIDGNRMNDVEPKNRDIAMVFQNYALYPHLTVYDNMAFGLQIRKYDKADIDKRVRNAAEILGLEALLDRKPAALSGGQRQRVALGRAIVRDAKVFLMDEPLSNLDAKLRVQMRTEIAKLHDRLNTTTIYVTHDQTEAMTLADRIVILNEGIIQQIGSPTEVYDKPNNVFVAGFMGSPAMNFIDVTYRDGYVTNTEGFKLKVSLPAEKMLNNKGYNGKELTLGIRPEDIHAEQISLEINPEENVVATVDVSELTGAETILYCNLNGTEFIARQDARVLVDNGDQIELAFNMNKASFFDKETTNRITNN